MPEFTNISASGGHLTSFITNSVAVGWGATPSSSDYITFDYEQGQRLSNSTILSASNVPIQAISTNIDWDSARRYISTHQGVIVHVGM